MPAILVFSDELYPCGGGAGVVAKQLACDLASSGSSLVVLSGDDSERLSAIVSSHIQVHRTTLVWPIAYVRALRRLDIDAFDLIILNDFVSAYVAGIALRAHQLSKAILIAHGADSQFVFGNLSSRHIFFQYRMAYRRTLRHCRQVVAVSRYARDLYSKCLPFPGFDRLTFKYAGLSREASRAVKPVRRTDIGVPEHATLLLSVSRLVEEKGLLNQLALFAEQVARGDDYYWLIAGSGPLESELRYRIAELGLAERVRLLGKVPRPLLAGYYSLADVFWLLSYASYETLGLVYLEAALHGTPSIGLRRAGVMEAIKEGVSGHFYEGGDLAPVVRKCLLGFDKAACIRHAEEYSSMKFAMHLTSYAQESSGMTDLVGS